MIRGANVCRDLSLSITGMLFNLTVNLTAKKAALSSRREFTVRSICELTVNLECEFQQPRGFSSDQRVGSADGKFPCSELIVRTVRHTSWLRAEQGNPRAGDETTCPSLIFGTTSSTVTLSERRSSRRHRRQWPALATVHARAVRRLRPLGPDTHSPQVNGRRLLHSF